MKKQTFLSLVAAFMLALAAVSSAQAQKLDAADVIAKHRAAVGTPDSLSGVKNQMIVANTTFAFKGGANIISGKGLILSASDKSLFGMQFASPDYPQDRFGFDGKNVKVGRATPNNRSLVGDFLYSNRDILKEGLLGGTLSARWPLFQEDMSKAKLKYDGTRNVDDIEAIVLSYEPKSGSDVTFKLFFDSKTFQHVRTEYTVVRNAGQGASVDASAGQGSTTFKLIEEFSNFSKMGKLTLPRDYKLTYIRAGTTAASTRNNQSRDAIWTFSVTDVGFNRDIDAKSFDIDAQ